MVKTAMILSAFVLLYISYTLRKTARGQLDIYDLFMYLLWR